MSAPEPPWNWLRPLHARAQEAEAAPPSTRDLHEDEDDVVVTVFTDYAATTKREQRITLAALAELIRDTTAATKQSLPWLKLARFGDARTERGSLRHNANVLAITGVESDYDDERMSFEQARDTLATAGVLALLYTSPSHSEDAPRWRVECPFSQEYPPDQRDRFLARLNGLFEGVFSRESWTLSQSYYFGSVNRNPSHQVAVLDGEPIDLMDHLDAAAIGKPEKPKLAATSGNSQHADPAAITDKRVNGKIESLLENIRNAPDQQKHFTLWDNALAIGGYLYLTDWSNENAVGKCIAALPPTVKDWNLARRTASQAVDEGRKKPLTLEDRPGYGRRPSPSPEQHADRDHGPDAPGSDSETEPDGDTAEAEDDDLDPPALPDLFVLKSDLPLVSQRLRERLAHHPWLFDRGGPARLVSFPPDQARQAEVHQLGIGEVAHAAHEVCRPYQVNWRGKRSDVTLPERVATLYLALNGRWNLRPLHGICGSVLLEDDGSIHSHEGYHAPSGMWCTHPPPLDVPDRPFKDQAVDALYRLRATMRTFTFKDSPLTRIPGINADVVDIDQPPRQCESAGVCGLLTAVCRPSLILAPGVLINAPAMSGSGAGKGLLARLMVAVGLGVIVEATAAGHDDAEFEKRIGTALLAGDPALLLDNLNNTLLRSGQLESCLTEPAVGVRVFGHLKKEKVLARIFVVLTGNGLQASTDGARRYIYPELEPPVDNPGERDYPPGFLADVIARRGELLSDCLTIWRWGRQQTHLKRGLPFGSYERWAAWVRDPLLALGCADPVAAISEVRERDPARVSLIALFEAWAEQHAADWVKADELDWRVRHLVDERERPAAIRKRLNEMIGTRLGGYQLLGKAEGNGKHKVWRYRLAQDG